MPTIVLVAVCAGLVLGPFLIALMLVKRFTDPPTDSGLFTIDSNEAKAGSLSALWFKTKRLIASADSNAWLLLMVGTMSLITYLSIHIDELNPVLAPNDLAKFKGVITDVDIEGQFMNGRRGAKDPIITVCEKGDCRKFHFEIFIIGKKRADVLHQIKTPVIVHYQPRYLQLRPPFIKNALWDIESTPRLDVQPYTDTYRHRLSALRNPAMFWLPVITMLVPGVLCFVGFWIRAYRLANLKSIGGPNSH